MLIILSPVCIIQNVHCQISNKDKPRYFNGSEKNIKSRNLKCKEIVFDTLSLRELNKEDSLDKSKGIPPRFGIPHEVNINMENSGEWFTLENGDKIWRMEIKAKGAKSINLIYDKFWLPDGASYHIYNEQKKHYIGGFNSRNNKGTLQKPGKFGTGLVFGNKVILEYFQPNYAKENGIISISKIVHGYRYINPTEVLFGDGGSCTVNVNCPEGANWQNEKTGVAFILVNGIRNCSGSLIKNVRGDGVPYFLTANHCLVGHDAVNLPDVSDWSFYWNYESLGCANGSDFTAPSTSGATVIANNSSSDFALLRLTESPYDLATPVQAYFNGWDRQNPIGQVTGIHHPAGDIKKISIASSISTSYSTNLIWCATYSNSILYGGSSGSPLFNSNKRIIGQAWYAAGYDCTSQTSGYGKFSSSWNLGSEPRRRLKDWLDPDNTDVNFLNGSYCNRNIANTTYSTNQNINACEVTFQNIQIVNGAKVVVDVKQGATLNGDFEVQLGSEFEIK